MTAFRPEDVAGAYWGTFSGAPRYAVWNGGHWLPQHGEPTTEAIIGALSGDSPALSPFFLDDRSATHLYALDLDAEDGFDVITKMVIVLVDAGVSCYPERSRRSGHLWIVADKVIPAIIGRRALMAAIERAGFDPTDKQIEIRPNTDRHSSDFAGGSLRAPWMAHPATGERYGLLEPRTLKPLHAKVAGAMLAMQFASSAAILALAETYIPKTITTMIVATPTREAGSVSSVLAERFGLQVAPGASCRCPFHADRNPSMKIARDDRRAWCHAAACAAHEDGRGITAWQAARLAAA